MGAGLLGEHGKGPGDQGTHEPVRERPERLAAGADAVREDLADEHPDHGPLAEGVRSDKEHETGQHDGAASFGVERPGDRAQTGDVADGADEHEPLAAEAVDHRHGQHREDQVRRTHDHALQAGEIRAGAGHLKDAFRVVQQGIDPRKLIEHRDEKGQHNRFEVPPPEERLSDAVVIQVDRLLDGAEFPFDVLDVEALQHGSRLVGATARHQPARA